MIEILKKYIHIELTVFPKNKRNETHLELINELTNYNLTFEDISDLLKEAERKHIKIRQPFFEKVIFPILEKEINSNNLGAIKHLIKLEQQLLQLQIRKKDYEPSKRQLLIKGLEVDSDEQELLEMYEHFLNDSLKFAIHELPSGVLYDMNGASVSQCDELLEELNDYKKVCEKLSLDRFELIDYCEFHFQAYKIYLQKITECSYQDFLKIYSETVLNYVST